MNEERQSAETARIQAAKISNEFELQTIALAEKVATIKELTSFYEAEKNALASVKRENADLRARLDE